MKFFLTLPVLLLPTAFAIVDESLSADNNTLIARGAKSMEPSTLDITLYRHMPCNCARGNCKTIKAVVYDKSINWKSNAQNDFAFYSISRDIDYGNGERLDFRTSKKAMPNRVGGKTMGGLNAFNFEPTCEAYIGEAKGEVLTKKGECKGMGGKAQCMIFWHT